VGLANTVRQFNQAASAGRDPQFHRGESPYDAGGSPFATEPSKGSSLAPLGAGPYYAAEVAPGDLGTCGGLRVNGRAEVIDVFDRPIQRLYAAGNSAGVGAPGALYGGYGGTLGPAMTYSYIAAMGLQKLAPADSQS
jgi:3-oxosteroid 1-dehydrogenase